MRAAPPYWRRRRGMSEILEAMARAQCTARGLDPDRCVIGAGWSGSGGGGMICHRYEWQNAAIGMEAALRAALEAAGICYANVDDSDVVSCLHRAAYPSTDGKD
jgi:hypothetical protein